MILRIYSTKRCDHLQRSIHWVAVVIKQQLIGCFDADATFEQVLREIELGSELAGAADVQELLTKREADGGLPPINPAAPHPFRGSGPGK